MTGRIDTGRSRSDAHLKGYPTSEAYDPNRSACDALAAYVEQMDRNETMPIIEMYRLAAERSGCNPKVLQVAIEHHCRPA